MGQGKTAKKPSIDKGFEVNQLWITIHFLYKITDDYPHV